MRVTQAIDIEKICKQYFVALIASLAPPSAPLPAQSHTPARALATRPKPTPPHSARDRARGCVRPLRMLGVRPEITRSFVISPADVVHDWVDVPLGRLEQYQRHIDPVPPPGDALRRRAAAAALTARTAVNTAC